MIKDSFIVRIKATGPSNEIKNFIDLAIQFHCAVEMKVFKDIINFSSWRSIAEKRRNSL